MHTGETERKYRVREKENEWDVRSLEEVKFTRARKKDSVSEVNPSTIADHVTKNNHTIGSECVTFPSRDSDTTKRGTWEAIAIKRTGSHAVNCDRGCHQLPPCYTKLLSYDTRGQH